MPLRIDTVGVAVRLPGCIKERIALQSPLMEDAAPPPFEPPLVNLTQNVPPEHARRPTLLEARLLVLAAALMWSTSGLFVKAPYFRGWPGPVLAFWRALFACLVLWPLVRAPRWTWKLVPMTLLFAAMNYTYLTAMVRGSAANAIWLQCTAPVWVLLVGVFVFGERAVWRDWLMVAFATSGVGFILAFESRGAALDAVIWGLVSGAFYAGVVLSLRHLRDYDPVWLAALNHLVTLIVLAPLAVGRTYVPSGIQWLSLAALGIVQMGLPYVLFAHGLKRIAGHEATSIGLIEPILVPVWVYLAWGDKPDWWTLVGGALILVGLAIRFLDPAPQREPASATE
jgi:DME family drug/metabolite transporter